MNTQSTLLLLVSIVLIAAGIAQLARLRGRRPRSRRRRDNTGVLLILIGGVLLLILAASGSIVLF